MRIPLDYYRILGVPVQATDNQLDRAYSDRSLQMPRREYSQLTIAARKQLLEEAYALLSDSRQRAKYDSQLQESAEEGLSLKDFPGQEQLNVPSLAIKQDKFPGALSILQELGEYELVLRLGYDYLQSLERADEENFLDSDLAKDTILTIALAYVELGREDYHKGEYENAARAVENGCQLLQNMALFPSVREEMDLDLYRLRPYRILELLAQEEKNKLSLRKKGLNLLQQMLEERHGIDGHGDDRSGLKTTDFLAFIQQIRVYLTTYEQEELFQAETQRSSAVANYLLVYVLLARGYAQRKPELILRAKEMLQKLNRKQDVNIELAVTCLLLGQPEETNLFLQESQEKETLRFIRENSQDSFDLLPGLCLYAEKWLQTEVFSQFRDLVDREDSLMAYFADENVQNYLEKLALSTQNKQKVSEHYNSVDLSFPIKQNKKKKEKASLGTPVFSVSHQSFAGEKSDRHTDNTAMMSFSLSSSQKEIDRENLLFNTQQKTINNRNKRRKITEKNRQNRKKISNFFSIGFFKKLSTNLSNYWEVLGNNYQKIWLFWLASPLVLIPFLIWIYHYSIDRPKPQSTINNNKPLVLITERQKSILPNERLFGKEEAKEVLEKWFTSKSIAFGRNGDLKVLNNILAPSILTQWRERAQALKPNNAYWQYQHNLEIRSVKIDRANPNRVVVEAQVEENAQYHKNGKLQYNNSYNDRLLINYQLVKQKDSWSIERIEVMKKLN